MDQCPALLERGRRVGLRHVVAADRAEYLQLRLANREHLTRWEPAPELGSDSYADEHFDRQLAQARTAAAEKLVVVELATARLIGHVSIGGILRGAASTAHIGYWIDREHEGRGCMREAVGLTLRYAFTTLGLHRVEANIMPINARSRAVVRACGFRYEGLARGLVQIAGAWRDHERYAITAEEWGRKQMLE